MGDKVIDKKDREVEVLGIIYGEVEGLKEIDKKWTIGLYEWINNNWRKSNDTIIKGTDKIKGLYLITESGELIIMGEDGKDRIVRDFTEVGYVNIHQTYSFVSTRLRITD